MKRLHRFLMAAVVAMLAGALALGAVSCGSDDDDKDGDSEPTATSVAAAEPTDDTSTIVEPGTLPITALEYRYEAPATISGGLTAITLENPGGEDHQAQLFLLNEGVTLDQFSDALNSDPSGNAALALGTVSGGANTVQAGGGTTEAIVDLEPGTYAMLCFVPNAEDVPHFALGMLAELEVTEATEEADPPPPDHGVTATDYQFTALSAVAAGRKTVQFINSGTEPHELSVVALQEGFTGDDLIAAFTEEEPTPAPGETPTDGEDGPPPFTSVGGVGAIPPGGSAYWVQNLEAGNYALLCFVPNADGIPHAALGMIAPFTVE